MANGQLYIKVIIKWMYKLLASLWPSTLNKTNIMNTVKSAITCPDVFFNITPNTYTTTLILLSEHT